MAGEFVNDLTSGDLDPTVRDQQIYALRVGGATLAEIGRQFQLTHERVRQILLAMGGVDMTQTTAARTAARVAADEDLHRRLRALAGTGLVHSLSQAAIMMGLDEQTLRRVGDKELSSYLGERRPAKLRWSEADVVNALQLAATYEWPLSRSAYQELVNEGEVSGPSAARIEQLYGWSRACAMANVEGSPRRRSDYQSNWTDDDLSHFASNYIEAAGPGAPFDGYDPWRVANASEPPRAVSSAIAWEHGARSAARS